MKKRLKVVFVFETIVTAGVFWLIAYYLIYERLAGGHPLIAYVYNIIFIIIMLILDKILDYFMTREDFLTRDRGKVANFFARLLFAAHFVSFKTALYLFYIAMLVVSRVSMLEEGLISGHLDTFINSVEFGVVLLIPLDRFIELITKDDRRIENIIARIEAKAEQGETASKGGGLFSPKRPGLWW